MHNFGYETTAAEVADAFSNQIKGKTILITGPTPGGIGYTTAHTIASHNPHCLILAGRSLSTLSATKSSILSSLPQGTNPPPIKLLVLDLANLEQVREAAEEVNAYEEKVDVLINNAGVTGLGWGTGEAAGGKGVEKHFLINHLGPFLFTNLLLPRMVDERGEKAERARVVMVASRGYRFGGVRFDDWNFENGRAYVPVQAYAQSKSANILCALSLAEKLKGKGLLAYSLHPGSIWTNISRHTKTEDLVKLGWTDQNRNLTDNGNVKWKTLEQGAATQVLAAFDPNIEGKNGDYLEDCAVRMDELKSIAPRLLDKGDAERLWKLSEELVGQEFDY